MAGYTYSSLPRVNILGIKDESVVAIPVQQESLPIYLPLIPFFSGWGPVDDALLTNGAVSLLYGKEVIDETSAFFKHQNLILQASNETGNTALALRLQSPGSKQARVRLALEIYLDELPQYERNPDGSWKRDSTGALIDTGDTLEGYTGRWLLLPIGEVAGEDDFGRGNPIEGTSVSPVDGSNSTVYPMMDIPARFLGKRGDNVGFRLSYPTVKSEVPVNGDLVEREGTGMLRLSLLERRDAFTDPVVQPTIFAERFVQFCLKNGVIENDEALYIDDVMEEAYELKDPSQRTRFSPIGEIHTYVESFEFVQNQIFVNEEIFSTAEALQTPAQTINLLGGKNILEVPYYTYRVLGPSDGGLSMTENATHYLLDGSDGDISDAAYDAAVAGMLENFALASGDVPLHDSARYPCSAMIDSGFSLETSKLLANLYRRKDMWFIAATQSAGDSLNTPMEDSSIAAALRSHLRSVPESTHFGTGPCRSMLMGNGGKLIGSKYRKYVPFTVLWARRMAQYAGGAEGYMKDEFAFDSAPLNVIAGFHSHNVTTKMEEAANRDWDNGLVQAQSFSTRENFWPSMKSIYPIESSILSSFMNVVIACNLVRIGEQAWRNYVGNSKLTNGQFVTRINRFVNEATLGKFDGRVDVTPNAYYTELDKALGTHWHLDIVMAGQNSKNVEHLSIIAQRRPEGDE